MLPSLPRLRQVAPFFSKEQQRVTKKRQLSGKIVHPSRLKHSIVDDSPKMVTIRWHVSAEEKRQLQKQADAEGYRRVGDYLRAKFLSGKKVNEMLVSYMIIDLAHLMKSIKEIAKLKPTVEELEAEIRERIAKLIIRWYENRGGDSRIYYNDNEKD